MDTLKALAPAIIGIAFGWMACRRLTAPGQDLTLSWKKAPSLHRSVATGIAVAVAFVWASVCAYVAPSVIPVLRGRGVPWADGTLAGFLNDTATASFVTFLAALGIAISMSTAAATLKQQRNEKTDGVDLLAAQQWLPVDPTAAQPGDIAVFDDNSTAIILGNGQLIGPDGQITTRNIKGILRSNIEGPPV